MKPNNQHESLFFRLNVNRSNQILNYLSLKELSIFGQTCKKANYLVQQFVRELQICIDNEYGAQIFNHLTYRHHIVLQTTSPEDFLFPFPPFREIRKLFLNFDGYECGKINLVHLPCLTHLKLRGPMIVLSANRLTTVTDFDFEDVDSIGRQVLPNVKNFTLVFDAEEMGQIYNTTEGMALERIFIKAFDILDDKKHIEDVRIEVSLNMGILLFEKFIDSVETFLDGYNQVMSQGRITIKLRHTTDYEDELEDPDLIVGFKPGLGLRKRYEDAFDRLTKKLPKSHYNFKIIIEEIERH